MQCFLLLTRQEKPQRQYLEIERHGDVNEHLISKGRRTSYAGCVILGHTNSSQLSLQQQQQSNTLQRRFVLRVPRSDDVIPKTTAMSSYKLVCTS